MKKQTTVNARQIAFFLAFLLPVGKLLELPSLLAKGAGGDLLLPALFGLFVEGVSLFFVYAFVKRTGRGMFSYLGDRNQTLGRLVKVVYGVVLILYSLPFLLDLEKFSLAAFSDTEPTFFSFLPFFVFSGYAATKGAKAVGRSADLCPVLFLLPFLGLVVLSIGSTDFSAVLPLFEFSPVRHFKTVYETAPFWCSGLLFLPLFEGYERKDGDGKKLALGYAVGAACVLLFAWVFYGLYGPLAEKEHYALSKIGQFFPALSTLGRTDLLLVYLMTVALLFFTVLPVLFSTQLFVSACDGKGNLLTAILLNCGLFLAVLFFNRRYNAVYGFFSKALAPAYFLLGVVAPLLFLLLSKRRRYEK